MFCEQKRVSRRILQNAKRVSHGVPHGVLHGVTELPGSGDFTESLAMGPGQVISLAYRAVRQSDAVLATRSL